MSFDPFAPGSELPPDDVPAFPARDPLLARKRVQAPAIALIVVGVLNLFLAAIPALQTIQATSMSPAEFENAIEKQNPQAREQMKQLGWTPQGTLRGFIWGFGIWAIVDFLASFVVFLGGIRMLSLKNHGLAIFAAILAAVPFLSCSGCCGLGTIVGIWAIVVLIHTEVRASFT